jgi:hypothetical protein
MAGIAAVAVARADASLTDNGTAKKHNDSSAWFVSLRKLPGILYSLMRAEAWARPVAAMQ